MEVSLGLKIQGELQVLTRTKRAVALTISQSINKFYLEIEEVLERLGLKYSKYLKEVENLNNIWIYKISQPDARKYLDKSSWRGG